MVTKMGVKVSRRLPVLAAVYESIRQLKAGSLGLMCPEDHVLHADHKASRYQYSNALIPNKAFPASYEGFDHLISANETVRKPSMRLG